MLLGKEVYCDEGIDIENYYFLEVVEDLFLTDREVFSLNKTNHLLRRGVRYGPSLDDTGKIFVDSQKKFKVGVYLIGEDFDILDVRKPKFKVSLCDSIKEYNKQVLENLIRVFELEKENELYGKEGVYYVKELEANLAIYGKVVP